MATEINHIEIGGQVYDISDATAREFLKSRSQVIPTTGWGSDSTATYPKYYDITVTGLTANDTAVVTVVPTSMDAAVACGLCPVCETLAGKLRLRAVNVPTTSFTVNYRIGKGA